MVNEPYALAHLSADIRYMHMVLAGLRQNGCYDIPKRNQLTDRKDIQQEVVKIEMNVATPIDFAGTNTMEFSIGNLKLCIPNGTDPVLLAQTIKILMEYVCQAKSQPLTNSIS